MPHSDPALESITSELAELRAALSAQQETIARQQTIIEHQQAAIAMLQQAASAPEAAAEEASVPTGFGRTSRRGLLRGAAAGAAAAAVATVAVGSANTAHAAAEATGGNFILGQANDADVTTTLTNTSGSLPNTLLLVSNSNGGNAGTGIEGEGGYCGVMGSAIGLGEGLGVYGLSDSGPGVFGVSSSSYGVWGRSALGVGGIFMGPQAAINLGPSRSVGVPTTGPHGMGDIYVDANATVWLCVGGGTPGTWVRLTGVASDAIGGAITYLSQPIRLLDTRQGQPAANTPGSPYAANSTHTIQVAGVTYNSVTTPASCAGAVGNLTIIGGSGTGNFVALVPSGAGFSGTANLAFTAGQVVSNAYNVGLSSGGALDIIIGTGGTSGADVILDLFAVVS